jgi:hypothetical protein
MRILRADVRYMRRSSSSAKIDKMLSVDTRSLALVFMVIGILLLG